MNVGYLIGRQGRVDEPSQHNVFSHIFTIRLHRTQHSPYVKSSTGILFMRMRGILNYVLYEVIWVDVNFLQ